MIIDILGLGESISQYTPSNNISFGVNDINRFHEVDYLVCLDKPDKFPKDRRKYIENNTAKYFYTHFSEWGHVYNFRKIELQQFYPNSCCDLDQDAIPKSCYSPFVAICLAYKMFKPNEIHLYGVDMNNHVNLNSQKDKIIRHTRNLKTALKAHNCSLAVHGNGILTHLD